MSATNQEKSQKNIPQKPKQALSDFYLPEYGVSVQALTTEEAITKAKAAKRAKEDQ